MSHSVLLRASDVAEMLRVVREVAEERREDQRRHMLLDRLAKMVGARTALLAEITSGVKKEDPGITRITARGFATEAEEAQWWSYIRTGDLTADPSWGAIVELAGGSFTKLREQLVEKKVWYGSDHVNGVRKETGCDAFIHSHVVLPWGVHALSLHREWKKKPFNERERLMVELAHREMARVGEMERRTHGQGGDEMLTDSIAALPPRLRQVFMGVGAGLSDKEIAVRLKLSRHTVSEYVQGIFKRFGVRSRGELMSHLAQVRGSR